MDKQNRINWLKNRISSMEQCRDEVPFGLSEDESMELSAYKDSLASLTAEPVLYAVDSDVEDKIYTALCNENEDGAYPLFPAPPIPEIKIPHELMDLVNAVEFYHAVKAENPNAETGSWNDAYDWIKKAGIEAAPVIKSLNGLGE
ncbi:hypothetical protein [Rosenbergiella epipactidis]|uniref:hypothetical protein n=1 Tax=Rosenbergiella epipactidis TaxID=1544694 RepID=UPI001F4E0438|nr:hypothetical protein [Rosenbergiella epipactidis]